MTYGEPARATAGRIPTILVVGLLVVSAVVAAIAAALGYPLLASSSLAAASPVAVPGNQHRGAPGKPPPSTVWPAHGQAAYVQTGQLQVQASPNQHAVPIASVAKVMTAYLVLRDHPLRPDEDGPTITLTAADVADTERRRGQQESVVSIAAGELGRRGRRLLRLPGHPLDPWQADDDHRRRLGPARPGPDRGGARGRRRHGRPHRQSVAQPTSTLGRALVPTQSPHARIKHA